MSPQDCENLDWNKVLVMGKDDFRHKYNLVLTLLGSAQNPAYAHPKLLGCCYDNVYHNGWFIGDLSARGKPPTEEQTKKIYNQEYKKVVARIKHTLDLTDESPSYSMTSLVNLDIVLPDRLFQERCGFPEICAVSFMLFIVGMQTSREQRDPTHLETSASLHGDYLKSEQLEAINCGEEYLKGTFEFHGAFTLYIFYYIYVVLL